MKGKTIITSIVTSVTGGVILFFLIGPVGLFNPPHVTPSSDVIITYFDKYSTGGGSDGDILWVTATNRGDGLASDCRLKLHVIGTSPNEPVVDKTYQDAVGAFSIAPNSENQIKWPLRGLAKYGDYTITGEVDCFQSYSGQESIKYSNHD